MSKSKNSKTTKELKSTNLEASNYSRANDTIKIIYGTKNAVAKGVEFMQNVDKKMDLCYDSNAPSIVVNVEEYRKGYIGIRERGGKIRAITEITKDNIEYCKELMKIVDELRHLDNVKGGTAINENEYMTSNILHESKPLAQVVYSNVRDVVEQQQKFFDSLWETAVPAKQKIRQIKKELDQKEADIFTILSSEIRRAIIFYLYENDMTVSNLAKKLNMTLQAIQKHFPKLVDNGLVERKSNGKNALTEIGYAVAKQIPSIEFLEENKEYLKTHSISTLPTQFLQRIGDLQKFEMVQGIKRAKPHNAIFEEAKEYIKIITLQNSFNVDTTFTKTLKNKVTISQISNDDTIISHKVLEQEKKETTANRIERRIVKNIPLLLCVSEKTALLGFLNHDGTADPNSMLRSKDKKFIGWCVDFFDCLWRSGTTDS